MNYQSQIKEASEKLSTFGSPVIEHEALRSILAKTGDATSSNLLIDMLERERIIYRASRSRFFYVPKILVRLDEADPDIVFSAASQLASPSYLGWCSAAFYYGFTTRDPGEAVYVASEESRGATVLFGREVRFQKTSPDRMYGIEKRTEFGLDIIVTDEMRTLLDCIDRPELCGGWPEVARILWESKYAYDPQKLVDHATRFPVTSVKQKLGFLLDTIALRLPEELRNRLKANAEDDPNFRTVLLANGSEPEVTESSMGFSEEWRVQTNFSKEHLFKVINGLP